MIKIGHLIQKLNNSNPIDKIYLYAKDISEPKYEFLINNCKNAGIKNYNDPNAFIEYSNSMDDVLSNIDDYNQREKKRILIVFDDMIADIMTNKTFQAIIKELFIRCRKLHSKIHSKKELQSIAYDNSRDIDFTDFLKMYKSCIKELYSFFTIDTPLPTGDPMRLRKNFPDSPL